ncbi:hypothetical protein [uncultured Flavobacterium sp.]|uniref:hypothetical protein n=1 Tax=uncultured Flavobacterium sp. TaxID=165435 RepID=UPI0030EBD8C9|tara:strand:- start:100150 stop:100839 length:690 start_codon:yes stop_codon:yes gene_type:complete
MSNEKIVLIALSILYIPLFLLEFFYYIKLLKRPKLNFKVTFKYIIASFIVIIIGILTLSHTNYLNYEKPIPYKDYNNIDFKKFKGIELFQKELFGSKYFAYVVTSIEVEYEKDSVSIISYFHPSSSFVYNKESRFKDLLKHELYHFKITELFARKAKEKISTFEKISKKEINIIVEEIELEERKFQIKYDYDTHHSFIYNKQIEYQKTIDSSLLTLNNFKNPKIKVYEN